ncbi:hypothetical protein [Castellaniella sp.]|uniref:hypothetical protein n=1 Tax=Castellaniella sp. TaxID=1955812 RepID=UPI002AFE23E9|nr:hypothetical protein [Castellaniella sp.]
MLLSGLAALLAGFAGLGWASSTHHLNFWPARALLLTSGRAMLVLMLAMTTFLRATDHAVCRLRGGGLTLTSLLLGRAPITRVGELVDGSRVSWWLVL